nr:hypothetical protein [uncultured Ruminococcus sp.]
MTGIYKSDVGVSPVGEVSRSDRGVPSPAEEEPTIHRSLFSVLH